MSMDLDLPWDRYALITTIARQFESTGRSLGKTALQKLVFFLQELHGVDVGYEFALYTYGPFCSDLMHDLDITSAMDGVAISYNPDLNEYNIVPNGNCEAILQRASGFVENNLGAIDNVIAEFGTYTARELELRATIVHAERDAHRREQAITEATLVADVHEIKPHSPVATIQRAVHELRDKSYINIDGQV